MYTSNSNRITDQTEMVAFMKRFSFATIITSQNGKPIATHLPFLVDDDGCITLTSHFAKANEHWKLIETGESLVIFNGPHAYISPKSYNNAMAVPTWNYISVHAYGQGKLVTREDELNKLLEKSIEKYEIDYMSQWNKLPGDFKQKMIKGIVGFKIEIKELEGKRKLSQNKSTQEQLNIISRLENSNDSNERLIAEYMKNGQEV